MDEQLKQELQDLQSLISAVRVAQAKGAYTLEQAAILAGNVKNVNNYIQKMQSN